jgi:hypothetical protein
VTLGNFVLLEVLEELLFEVAERDADFQRDEGLVLDEDQDVNCVDDEL